MHRSKKVLVSIQLVFVFMIATISCLPNQIKIGLLLGENQYEQEIIFKWSIEQINQNGLLGRTKLVGQIKRVNQDDCWDAEMRACELLESGCITVIGPLNPVTSQHVSSVCDALDIPHVNIVPKRIAFSGAQNPTMLAIPDSSSAEDYLMQAPGGESPQSTISVDLSISRSVYIGAYLDLVRAMEWHELVYLYEQDESLYHFQQHFNGKSLRTQSLNVRVIHFDPMKQFRQILRKLKESKWTHAILDIECSHLKTVLKHAQQVSLMTETHTYLIVCPDAQTIDLEEFVHSRTRLVWLSATDPMSEAMDQLARRSDEMNMRSISVHGNGFRLIPEQLSTESALIHDAIESMAQSLRGMDSSQTMETFSAASCAKSKPWTHGSTLVNYLRTSVEFDGMSGRVLFDPLTGQRSGYELNVIRSTELGPRIIGNWSQVSTSGASNANSREESRQSKLLVNKQELAYLQSGDLGLNDGLERDTLIVTSVKSEPYFMFKNTSQVVTGNARYEGYSIDLIDELSRIVGFDYVFKEVDDGYHGKLLEDNVTWNGMIREVMIGKADLAIGDLSITSSREDAVDFTLPFMSTGISILFKKPTVKELELFSFLSPFDTNVWFYVMGAYFGVSIFLFSFGRISPYEWADPHPCRQENKILRNQFSLSNSFWFTIAAVMQQGSDLAPRALSTRLISAMWYFFTLIMISSYTANLAAFLTVEKVVYPIEKAEDLYNHPQHIGYGALDKGSTAGFFANSHNPIFKAMSQNMINKGKNSFGRDSVEEGNYAFFMESTSIEYIVERYCNLTQIGGLLDQKGYGIAIAKNSTRKRDYRTKLSEAILSLQESGTLEVLKTRWWKEKRGGGACDVDDSQSGDGVKELTLENVGGVFVVLGMGLTAAFIICGFEMLYSSNRQAKVSGTTRWKQLKRRFGFALSLSENY